MKDETTDDERDEREAIQAGERCAAGSGASHETDDGWDNPIAFDTFDVPAFPIDVLPDWAKTWCLEEATALQVPVNLPALLVLAVVSVCIAKKVAVNIKPGWVEQTNIYAAVTLGVGEGKSPAFTHATAPLHDWEEEQRAKLKPRIADLQEQRHLLDERLKDTRKRATKRETQAGKNAEEEARELAVKLDELRVPPLPRLVADDATPEAVGRLLSEQGGRLGVFSSEGGPLAILAGRYSEGRANLELFCKAYSGDPYTLDRMGRPSLHVRSPLLTIALTVQPSVIAGLADTEEMRGQGLLARFLYAVPRSKVGEREADPPSMDAATSAAYVAAIRKLLDLEAEADDANNEVTPRTIALAADARGELVTFKRGLEPRLGLTGDLHSLADWGNKLTGTTARIACVLHVADRVEADPFDPFVTIERGTVVRAIALAKYAIEHARVAFGLMGADPVTEVAKHVLAWLVKQSDDVVSQRDIHRGVHSRVKRAADLAAPIAILVERGYLRPVESAEANRTGRPPGPTYAINPRAKRCRK